MKNEVKKFEVGKAYWAGNDFANSVLVIKERKGKKVTFDVVSKKNIFDAEWNVIGREAYVQYADVCKTVTVGDDCDYEMISYKVPYSGGHRVTTDSIDYEVVGGSEGLDAFQEQILAEVKLESKERAIKATENMSNEELLKNISNGKWTIHCIKFSMENSGITSVDELYFNDREKYAAATARLEVYEKAFNDRVNESINAMAAEMVDDGSNDDAEEENVTTEYNFDVEEDDDELVDPPIEYHIVEVPAAVELEPVTFAIERFGEVAEEETKLREEYAAIEKEIAVLNEKLAKMHGRRYEVGMKINAIVEPNLNGILQKAKEAFKAAKAQEKSMEIVTPDGNDYYWIECGFGWELVNCYVDLAGEVVIDIDEQEMARYVNWKAGAAAIEGLTAAIERGDDVYTFPTNA